MKLLLIIVGLLIVFVLVILVVGLLQPVKHSLTRAIHLKQKPEAVFAVLETIDWSSGISKAEPLPDRDGKKVWRVTLSWGGMQMIMTQLERVSPTRLVTMMAKDGGPVFGTWTYQLDAEESGCRVTLTENGELKNPFYRAMARLRGLDANIRQTLADLAKKFGETATVE